MKYSFYNLAVLVATIAIFTITNFHKITNAQNINGELSSPILNLQKRKEIEKIIQKYIQENPEVIIKSIQKMREKQEHQAKENSLKNLTIFKKKILNDPKSPIAGNADGDVSVVEFFDYSCGYCKRIFPNLKKLIADDKNIRIVFKELPILSPRSELAARAALAVWHQDKNKYIEIHKDFMGLKGAFTKERIFRIAKNKGINLAQLEKDINSAKITKIIRRNHQLAQKLNITGTPAFVIGNNIIPGAIKLETLKQLIDKVRKERLRAK